MSFHKDGLNAIQRERYDRLVQGLSCSGNAQAREQAFHHALVPDKNDLLKVPGALSAASAEAMRVAKTPTST